MPRMSIAAARTIISGRNLWSFGLPCMVIPPAGPGSRRRLIEPPQPLPGEVYVNLRHVANVNVAGPKPPEFGYHPVDRQRRILADIKLTLVDTLPASPSYKIKPKGFLENNLWPSISFQPQNHEPIISANCAPRATREARRRARTQ